MKIKLDYNDASSSQGMLEISRNHPNPGERLGQGFLLSPGGTRPTALGACCSLTLELCYWCVSAVSCEAVSLLCETQ